MAGMPWIKLYTEVLDDVKLARLNDAQKWRFVQLLALAGECDAAGAFVTSDSRMTLADISWRLRCDTKALEKDIAIMLKIGLLREDKDALYIAKWTDRQGPTQDEKRLLWRNRQEKRRNSAKSGGVTRESPVTPPNVTPPEEDEDIDKEEDKEEESPAQIIFSTYDAERLYCQVTTFAVVPTSAIQDIDKILSMLQAYGWDATLARCRGAFKKWTSTKRKDNGANYSPTNPKWIEWAISGEVDRAPESDVERALRQIDEQAKRLNP